MRRVESRLMSRPARGIGWLIVTLCLLGPRPARAQSESAWAALVADYRAGNFDRTAAELAGWPDERVRSLASAERSDEAVDLRAAAMLHTEAAFERTGPRAVLHIDAAERFVRRLKGPAARDFSARWYALAATYHVTQGDGRRAQLAIARGLTIDSHNPHVRLLVGVIDETALGQQMPNVRGPWQPDAGGGPFARDMRGIAERVLNRAAQNYRAILSDSPDFLEARLRLGYVSLLNHSTGRARDMLEEVALRSKRADLQYLAHLFLSGLAQQANHPDDAVHHAEVAHAVSPGQASFAALVRLESARGNNERVALLMEDFADAGDDLQPDPWAFYRAGVTSGTLVESLRVDVTAP